VSPRLTGSRRLSTAGMATGATAVEAVMASAERQWFQHGGCYLATGPAGAGLGSRPQLQRSGEGLKNGTPT